MKDLELLATYPTEFEAELVRNKLGARGIEAMLEAQDRSNMIPSLDYANGFHLYVELEDLELAKTIIEDEDDDLMEDEDMEEV
jgi:H2-forming N5,N10-methylenetetrahydromethanopterin dehydrogenase-like enzyme